MKSVVMPYVLGTDPEIEHLLFAIDTEALIKPITLRKVNLTVAIAVGSICLVRF